MIGLQLIAEMNIGGGQKKQSDAEREKYNVKHDWLQIKLNYQDAQALISLRYGFGVCRIRKL